MKWVVTQVAHSKSHPSSAAASAALNKGLMGGTHWIRVGTLGRDLPPVSSLQNLVYAHNQRISFAYELLHQHSHKLLKSS
jgi:hypothetical protein